MPSPPCSWGKMLSIFILGLFFVILGVLSIIYLDEFVHYKVSQEMPLREPVDNTTSPSVAYRFWKDIPTPMYMAFRFFHVENPSNITKFGGKPVLTEKGPYVYSERRHKTDIVFSENGTLVSFREDSVFHFVREMSVGDEDDEVQLLNVPFLTVLNKAKDQSGWMRMKLSWAITLTGTKLFETKTVRQWIWGYDDPLLQLIKISQPDMVPFTFFGWFMHRNDSDTGGLTIKTGVDDLAHEAQIVSWKNASSLDDWTDSYCNAINGTDGTMFHPFVERNETLYVFTSDICRSIYAQYEKDVEIRGVAGFKFVPSAKVFADRSVNPDNACFCVPDLDHCLGAGVLNISKCQFGAPVVSSSPHLYQADPTYLNRLKGLHPSKDLHQTYLDVEPVTGMVLEAAKRLQINAFVDNIPAWSTYFEKFPDKIIFPVIWFEETATLDADTAAVMRGQVTDQLHLVFAVQVSLCVFGGFWICAALLLVFHKIHSLRRGDKSPFLEPVEEKSAPAAAGLAFENPIHRHSPIHEDRPQPVTTHGASDEARADAAICSPELGTGADQGPEGDKHSINSKSELPKKSPKIAKIAKISG